MTELSDLVNRFWTLRTQDRTLASVVRLARDGRVIGADLPVRSHWQLVDGKVQLQRRNGKVGCVLEADATGLKFTGASLTNSKDTITMEETTWEARPRWKSLTRTRLSDDIRKHQWVIGDHTHGKPTIFSPRPGLRIGKFVSMDPGVTIALAERRIDAVSSYPFQGLRRWWPNASGTRSHDSGPVTIGNDVWIGTGAVIMPGVTIGDGAVIGPQAVVREDVAPYTIAEGVPAKPLGRRFDDATVERLLAVAWWNWPDEMINEFLPIMDQDVERFLTEAERLGSPGA